MNKEPLAKKMKNICAWCGKVKHEALDESAIITYGICPECLDTVMTDKVKR